MKQTIFNASMEESMNLVTDEYIKISIDDFNEKVMKNFYNIINLTRRG